MKKTQTNPLWDILVFVLLGAAFIAALPLLAGMVLLARVLFLALLAIGVLLFISNSRFRGILVPDGDPEISYNGFRVPSDFLLHPFHAWAKPVDGEVLVGGDDLWHRVLGPAEDVELPRVGQEVSKGEPLAWFRRGRRQLTLKAPVSGRVVSTNGRLKLRPELGIRVPYGQGWVARLKPTRLRIERGELHTGGRGRRWFRSEVDGLLARLHDVELGATLADGGVAVESLHAEIDDETWTHLSIETFGCDG